MHRVNGYEFRDEELESTNDTARYGVYVLVWKDSDPSHTRVYVGQSKDVRARLGSHRSSSDNSGWSDAYAIVSPDFHLSIIYELEALMIATMRRLGRLRKRQDYSNQNQMTDVDRNLVGSAYAEILKLLKEKEPDLFNDVTVAESRPNSGDSLQSDLGGQHLYRSEIPKRKFYTPEDVMADLQGRQVEDVLAELVKETLNFCRDLPDVQFVKRTDQRHLRYAATVGNHNFCIIDVLNWRVRLNIALRRDERDSGCTESTVTNEKFCMHDLLPGGLTEYLKGHIQKAHDRRNTAFVSNSDDPMTIRTRNNASSVLSIARFDAAFASKTPQNKPVGDQAVKHARAKLNGSLQTVFDILITQLQQLNPLDIKWRDDNRLNFAKLNNRHTSATAIMVESRRGEIRVHLFFEKQSPATRDARLQLSTANKHRAYHIDIRQDSDVDSLLLSHIHQAWSVH